MPGIKFPKMHIAASVTNRILNVADELEASKVPQGAPGAQSIAEPRVPDTAEQSMALDAQLGLQVPEMPPIDQAADPGGTVAGKPLLSTILEPES